MPGTQTRQELPTVDRLRHDIDRGRTGEKVDFPDPAAAPLGTDMEAAGHAPRPDEIAMELADNKATQKRSSRIPGIAIYSVVAGAVAASLLVIIASAAA